MFAFAYLLYPATQFNAFTIGDGFHAVSFAVPLILYAVWFLDEDRLVAFSVVALLAFTTKEELPLAVGCLGIWYAVRRGHRLFGFGVFAAGLAVTLFNFLWVIPHFAPKGSTRSPAATRRSAGRRTGSCTSSSPTRGRSSTRSRAGTRPATSLCCSFRSSASGSSSRCSSSALCPTWRSTSCRATRNQTTVQFQYTAGIVPFVVAASIFGAARASRAAGDWTFRCGASRPLRPSRSTARSTSERATSERSGRRWCAAKAHAVSLIPDGVPVAASNQLGGHLSERRYIYTFPFVRRARWIVVDTQRLELSRRAGYKRQIREYEANKSVADRLLLARRDRAAQASDGASVSGADGRRSPTPPLSIHAWLRYSTIESLLSQIQPRNVLEIGVGQGSVGVLLARRYDYTGIDLDETALDTARSRFRKCGVDADTLLLGGLEKVEEREFDLVCAFEVLEHLEDDVAALTDWHAHVAPGGWLALSVPADPRRFGKADEKAGHYRRYTRETSPAS